MHAAAAIRNDGAKTFDANPQVQVKTIAIFYYDLYTRHPWGPFEPRRSIALCVTLPMHQINWG